MANVPQVPLLCCATVSASEPERTEPVHLPSWFDGEDAPGTRDLNTCIHCGLCLTACPTYRTLKIEPDSPRGRLYLMRGLAEGRIAPSDPLVGHLDRCLRSEERRVGKACRAPGAPAT